MEKQKNKFIGTLHKIGLILWPVCVISGAAAGGSDGSVIGGAFGGFCAGLGIIIIISFITRSIENPFFLLAMLIAPGIGFLIGLIWGWKIAIIGAIAGAVFGFLFVAGAIKEDE